MLYHHHSRHFSVGIALVRRQVGIVNTAASVQGQQFIPFVVTAAEGIVGPGAAKVLNQLAEKLADKWGKSKASVRSWLHSRIAFAIIRGSSRCISTL